MTKLLIFMIFSVTIVYGKTYTLKELSAKAVKKDPRIEDFELTQKILVQKVKEIENMFYPKITYTASIAPMGAVETENASGSIDDMTFSRWGVGYESKISLVQPIYSFGKWSVGKEMARKGIVLAEKQLEKLKQNALLDTHKAYYTLLMIDEIQNILDYGENQIKKAQKSLKKMEENDHDDFEQNDLFRINIALEELIIEQKNLKRLKEDIRYGLIKFLNIEEDFSISPLKEKNELPKNEISLKNLPEKQIFQTMVEINKLDVSLKKRNYFPDLAIVAGWNYKGSNVAKRQVGYDPYYTNNAAVALTLKWNFDFGVLYAKENHSKRNLIQIKHRIELLEKKASVEGRQLLEKLKTQSEKTAHLKKIAKEYKKWFLGNAADYYMGLGKTKDLLDTLANYQKARIELIKAEYEYQIFYSQFKSFLGEL